MKELDPVELSAFLDGELDPRRAGEIKALIAGDEEVCAQYEDLRVVDAQLRSFAETAAFEPHVTLPSGMAAAKSAWRPLLLLLFPGACLAGKLAGAMPISIAINCLSLLALILGLHLLTPGKDRADRLPFLQAR